MQTMLCRWGAALMHSGGGTAWGRWGGLPAAPLVSCAGGGGGARLGESC